MTVKSLDGYSIEDYGIGLARKWGIGQKGKDNGDPAHRCSQRSQSSYRSRPPPRANDDRYDVDAHHRECDPSQISARRFAGGIKDAVRDIKTVLLGDAEEVKQRAQGGRTPQDDPTVMIHIVIWLLIFAFIIWINYRNMQAVGPGTPGTPRGGVIIVPGGSGNWGGGSSGGGGGGGWSGGGGGFGGGGASGSW